jgi:hypothetical protein
MDKYKGMTMPATQKAKGEIEKESELENELEAVQTGKQGDNHDRTPDDITNMLSPTTASPVLSKGLRHTNTLARKDEDYEQASVVIYPEFYRSALGTITKISATEKFQLANDPIFEHSTAEIAANSPRYRRRSSTFIDGVHDLPGEKSSHMAPAQLYSTMSGRLFHSGRIAIVLVGPPARGKTYELHPLFRIIYNIKANMTFRHISVSLCRYLQWLVLHQYRVLGANHPIGWE